MGGLAPTRQPFRTGRFLGDGSILCCRIPRHLAAASGLPAPVPLLRNFSNGWTGRQWLEATRERYAWRKGPLRGAAIRRLRRPDSQRREARRPAGRAVVEVRACH